MVLSADRATWPSPEAYKGDVVLATLKGKPADLRPYTDDIVKAAFPGAKVEVHRDYEHDEASIVKGIAADSSAIDDVAAYIQASDRGGLDPARLVNKAQAIAESAPERKGLFA